MGVGGNRIREIRQELRISQAALAALLKVTDKSIGRWERGETEPKYEHVAAAERLLSRSESRSKKRGA